MSTDDVVVDDDHNKRTCMYKMNKRTYSQL